MSAARKEPRQERSRFTVEAILTATERVVAQHGVEGATTNRIAEVAGVSIGSLYQYFPNKDALVTIVRQRSNASFKEEVDPVVEGLLRLPVEAATRGMVDVLIARHRETLALHNALASRDDALHRELEARWTPLIVSYLRAHQDEIRPRNLELAARIGLEVVESLIHGVALRSPELLADPEFADEVHALLVGYFRPMARDPHRPED